jgi:uncharacterized protein YdaU (DUF1376 family)
MDKEITKFHALQLFTDTFTAETVHLTNEAIGIYIRLLSFAWTKNTKPFKEKDAMRICQCRTPECELRVMEVLTEFFLISKKGDDFTFTHKRLVQEHAYLTDKYHRRSEAGKKGGLAKRNNATSKTLAPIPIPIPSPIPNNIYDPQFEKIWSLLDIRRGSKFKAHEIWNKLYYAITLSEEQLSQIYNKQINGIEDKFVPHFSTWLSQRRWENEEIRDEGISIRAKMEKLGYIFRHREDNFDYFKKDGKEYKIDRYDKDHIIQKAE